MTTDLRPSTPLLDKVAGPADLKALSTAELRQLADELRAETISAVSARSSLRSIVVSLSIVSCSSHCVSLYDLAGKSRCWSGQ